MEKNDFLKKITLPSQNLRYLSSGKSVFRLIAKGRDTYVFFIQLFKLLKYAGCNFIITMFQTSIKYLITILVYLVPVHVLFQDEY